MNSPQLPKHPHDRVWRTMASYMRDHGKSPTVRELIDLLDKSNGSIQNSRKWLAKNGFIAIEKGKPGMVMQIWPKEIPPPENMVPRALQLIAPVTTKQSEEKSPGKERHLRVVPDNPVPAEPLPIQGEIAAGAMFEPVTDTQEYLTLDYAERKVGDFVLRVSGRSMVGDCIPDGAFVVMRPTPDGYEPRPGEIVAVWVEGAGTTLKHFYQEKGMVVLESSNPEVPPQMIDVTERQVRVQATHLLTHWRSRFSG